MGNLAYKDKAVIWFCVLLSFGSFILVILGIPLPEFILSTIIILVNIAGLIFTIIPNFLPFININFNFYIISAFFVINIASETTLMFDEKFSGIALMLGSLSKLFAIFFSLLLHREAIFERQLNRIGIIKIFLATIFVAFYLIVFEFTITNSFNVTRIADYLIISLVVSNVILLIIRKPIIPKIRISIFLIGLAYLTGFLTIMVKPRDIPYEMTLYNHLYRNIYLIYSVLLASSFYFYLQTIIEGAREKTGLLRRASLEKYQLMLDSASIDGYFSVNLDKMQVKEYSGFADSIFGFKNNTYIEPLNKRFGIDLESIIKKTTQSMEICTSKLALNSKTYLLNSIFTGSGKDKTVLVHITDITKQELEIVEEKKRSKTLELLVNIANAANKFKTSAQICEYTIDSALSLLGYEYGAVFLTDIQTGEITSYGKSINTVNVERKDVLFFDINNQVLKDAIKSDTEQHFDIGSSETDSPLAGLMHSLKLGCAIIQPININTEKKGCLVLASRNNTVLSRKEIQFAMTVSTQLSMALDRHMLVETLQQKYKSIEYSNRTKDELITMISHELKTPLTSIVGYIELLDIEKNNLNKRQKEFITTLHHQSDVLSWLVSGIDMLATLKTNRYVPDYETVDLYKVLQRLEGRFTKHDSKNEISIECDLPEETRIRTDVTAFISICSNLLAVFERLSEGESSVNLEISKSGDSILIVGTDNSAPIGNQDWEKIFDIFTTLQSKPSTTNRGSIGLPLSIVKEFANLLGGNIWLHSVDNGNKIVVLIPDVFVFPKP